MLLVDMSRPTVSRRGWPYELAYPHGVPSLVNVVRQPSTAVLAADRLLGEKPVVIPSTIVLDHGRENDSLHLIAAADRLGIGLDFCTPAGPHEKGTIESVARIYDGRTLTEGVS